MGQVGTTEGKAPQHLPGFCCHKQQADGQQRHGGGTAVGRVVLARLPGALPWPLSWLQACPGGVAGPAAQKQDDQDDEQQLQQQGAGQPESVEACW